MNGPSPSVEERLRRLVDDFTAPATTTALRAIEGRTQVLRRRRRVGVATAAGVVGVVVAVIVALALRNDPSPERTVELDPVQPPEETGMPAFTLDLDGWEVISATDEHDVPFGVAPPPPADGSTETGQVFHPPGEQLPSVYVAHSPIRGTIGQQIFDDPVTIGGVNGLSWTIGEEVALTWNPHGGNTTVWLRARGLPFDEVVEFAEGLQPRDADIAVPPGPDDRFGFDATARPAGLAEDPVAADRPATIDQRIVTLSKGTDFVWITVDNAGQRVFYEQLSGVIADTWASVTVLDRPATLFTREFGPSVGDLDPEDFSMAELNWLHTTTARVRVEISTDDEAEIEEIMGGLRQISRSSWEELVAGAPPTTTSTSMTFPP